MKSTFIFIIILIFAVFLFAACSTTTINTTASSSEVQQEVSPLNTTMVSDTVDSVESTPDKVVEKMYKATNDGDGKSFLECWDTETSNYKLAKKLDDKGRLTDKRTILTVMGFDLAIEGVELLSVKVEDSDETTAKVTAELKVSSGARSMETPIIYNLIKKDGKWYITQ